MTTYNCDGCGGDFEEEDMHDEVDGYCYDCGEEEKEAEEDA